MTKEAFIISRIPIEELTEVGFFKKRATIQEVEKKVCDYFSLKNIFMYDFIMKDSNKPVKADLNTFSIN